MKLTLTVGCLLFLTSSARAFQAEFVPLGHLPGAQDTAATAVNADGTVVVGFSSNNMGQSREAFRWSSSSGMVALGFLPGGVQRSDAVDVSASGSVIVGSSGKPNGSEAFLWTAESGMIGLGFIPGTELHSEARAVSADGSTVVGSAGFGSTSVAFIWRAETGMQRLTDASGDPMDSAWGVNADGTVVVGDRDFSAVRWTQAGGIQVLDPAESSTARAVNAGGDFVIGTRSGSGFGDTFLWSQATGSVSLGNLPVDFDVSASHAIDASGGVVALTHLSLTTFDFVASLWTGTSGQILSVKDYLTGHGASGHGGWNLRTSMDVSLDGNVLVGSGVNPSGTGEAWLARLTPAQPSVLSSNFCFAQVPNSSGAAAFIHARGSEIADYNYVILEAQQLPVHQFGYFLGATAQAPGFVPASAMGNLCLGGSFARFNRSHEIRNSGAAGTMSLELDLFDMPTNPGQPVLAGQTWYFQAWCRDNVGGATSNFTDGLAISFE